mgnify:CR=1 FL=1
MRLSITDEAIAHIQKKGGRAAVDLICLSS